MQEEVLTSISEIDKTRKLYFDEEHLAKQARDKEEKYKPYKLINHTVSTFYFNINVCLLIHN